MSTARMTIVMFAVATAIALGAPASSGTVAEEAQPQPATRNPNASC